MLSTSGCATGVGGQGLGFGAEAPVICRCLRGRLDSSSMVEAPVICRCPRARLDISSMVMMAVVVVDCNGVMLVVVVLTLSSSCRRHHVAQMTWPTSLSLSSSRCRCGICCSSQHRVGRRWRIVSREFECSSRITAHSRNR